MIKNYLAITIGPIDKTLTKALKTREVWLSSYIFSYLMGLIVMEIISRKTGRVILPDASLLENQKEYYGAGVFNDRCFIELEKDFKHSDFENLRECVINSFLFGKKLCFPSGQEGTLCNTRNFSREHFPCELLKLSPEALKDYLQIYGLVTELDTEKDHIIDRLNKLLDGLERQSAYQVKENTVIEQLFENVAWFYPLGFDLKNNEIKQLEVTKTDNNGKSCLLPVVAFPTTIEISAHQYINNDSDIDKILKNILSQLLSEDKRAYKEVNETNILTLLRKKNKSALKAAHQYFCVVHVNADNLCNYYNKIGNDWNKVNRFNNCMISFAKDAVKIIHDFGGQPIYAAGDDLFFLAPVLTTLKGNFCNVFDLIRILDFVFKDIFSKKGILPLPDLSCGLSVLHYKYPLTGAVLQSRNLLSKAKDMFQKNSLAVQLIYSDGKSCQAIFSKSKNSSFDDFIELLKDFPSKSFYVSSVQRKIHDNMSLLQAIGKDNPPDFIGFFKNEYKSADMDNAPIRLFIERSSRIFTAIFKEQKLLYANGETLFDAEVITKACEGAMLQLDSIYRILNFLNQPYHV